MPRLPAAGLVVAGLLLNTACSGGGEAQPSPAGTPGTSPSAASPPAAATTTAAGPASSPPAATSQPDTGSGSGGGDVFSGTRQVYLLPENSEATLGVVGGGRIGLSEAFDDNALFVLTPAGGDRYRIRTAKLRAGGEALCVSAKLGAGGKPGAVVTTGCDAAAGDQLFRFRRTGESNGKPTYTIRTGSGTYIIQDPNGDIAGTGTGVAAVSIGEGTPDIDTPFVIPDKGKATLPPPVG
ncbi:hypothetical protein Aph02nite_24630 [Actinoplanes philippinensis]|uniref:Ricin B lectin domain-containing protein n=1 Tax=Actinoplanes philippinensis TaxID=35752 RepID=A0A1I2G2I6_9ACTN|nr:hypothetical protein [Actinoplanes philippinensis]GIE76513.1 hypothetical protein Aph02nite_24630 [Actinoplanes philippinensis]SFF11207.1 hypothetical protein SAMN05421541_106122 [Actinoplanes philippinensis]